MDNHEDIVSIREGDGKVVVRRNELVLGHFRLSMWAHRLFLILVAHVTDATTRDTVFRFEIAYLARWMGVDKSHLYTDLVRAVRELEMTKVTVDRVDGLPGWCEVGLIQNRQGFISHARHRSMRVAEGAIEFHIHKELLPYVKELSTRFTKVGLSYALRLRSSFSQKIYDLVKVNEFRKQAFEISIADLRKILAMKAEEYANFADFRRFVLEPAAREVCQKTDICFTWEAKKSGKKVEAIVFDYCGGACNIEFLPETTSDKLLQRLVKAGVANDIGADLVRLYSTIDPDRIAWALDEALRKHRKGELSSPAGWIVTAIKEDWRPTTTKTGTRVRTARKSRTVQHGSAARAGEHAAAEGHDARPLGLEFASTLARIAGDVCAR